MLNVYEFHAEVHRCGKTVYTLVLRSPETDMRIETSSRIDAEKAIAQFTDEDPKSYLT